MMGEKTDIQWCDHTFNPWVGCFKVSPGCKNCYAARDNKRFKLGEWGPVATTHRHIIAETTWKQPLTWNRVAARTGDRHRVFCASWADVFEEHPDVAGARPRLWDLISQTPSLDWLLLTKRPQHVLRMIPEAWRTQGLPENIWLGTSVENQKYADERIPLLLQIPARVRFLSCEPLLGPVDITGNAHSGIDHTWLYPQWLLKRHGTGLDSWDERYIHWVICGGESGTSRRRLDIDWVRSIRDQCQVASIPFFFKQGSARLPGQDDLLDGQRWKEFPDGSALL